MNTAGKTIALIIVILVALGGAALAYHYVGGNTDVAEAAVRTDVTGFGTQQQKVSLLAPDAGAQIAQIYAPYVSAALLSTWQSDPASAPGRQTSSPWPDHIDISSVTKNSDGTYAVAGSVILMTSNETEHGGNAGTIPVTMTVTKEGTAWHISAYQQSAPQPGTAAPVTTTNPPASTTPQPVGSAPMIHVPHIDSIQPSSGPAGTSVTLTGSGFNSTSQILIGSGAYGRTTVNAAGTVLTFTASDSAGAYCHKNQACPMYALLLKPGAYGISVGNDDGTKSNSVQFTLTGTTATL